MLLFFESIKKKPPAVCVLVKIAISFPIFFEKILPPYFRCEIMRNKSYQMWNIAKWLVGCASPFKGENRERRKIKRKRQEQISKRNTQKKHRTPEKKAKAKKEPNKIQNAYNRSPKKYVPVGMSVKPSFRGSRKKEKNIFIMDEMLS
eukprot:GEMP01105859.1.p1 GENE.GEMP01105859.1~~GEMP01105859.1.p1  ORF type:complete len:147 (-),score=1.24 GEMP01105859.1:3-443(-)